MKRINAILILFIYFNAFSQAKQAAIPKQLTIVPLGFNKVEITTSLADGLTLVRVPISGVRPEHGFTKNELIGKVLVKGTIKSSVRDVLPTSLAEVVYRYQLVDDEGGIIASAETSRENWMPDLLPKIILPQHPTWLVLYNKAWELNWRQIATSRALPARFSFNVTPDNGRSYLWDASFSILFQRYGVLSGENPGISTIDNFYAQQSDNGYILRYFTVKDFAAGHNTSKTEPSVEAVNPPLLAWAEWNYFKVSGNAERLKVVLPKLVKQYDFVESFLQKGPGKYIWDGNPSGWDNILKEAKHHYWVELPAMQALSAKYIIEIASIVNDRLTQNRFLSLLQKKKAEMKVYWNSDKKWYCSLDQQGRFTQKTLSGMWPVLAGIVPPSRLNNIVDNLMDPNIFNTSAIPLPCFAKDELGYNPKGEYWLGSVWINMSMVAIRSLKEQGFDKEAVELAVKTLNGMSKVYSSWSENPGTLWECYSPEYPAPASHKVKTELGSVRKDFAGWTACLVNLLIENVLGIEVDAWERSLNWKINLNEEQGIENLKFGNITTSLLRKGSAISVKSNHAYTIHLSIAANNKTFKVVPGANLFKL